jgi:hypothetical protein
VGDLGTGADARRENEEKREDGQTQQHHGSAQHGEIRSRRRQRRLGSGPDVGERVAARYIDRVKTFLAILVAVLMFATLGVLFAGLLGLARGGGNPQRSNRLMRWRVILQGAALLLFMLLMTLLRS